GLRQRKRRSRERIAVPDEGPSDTRTASPLEAAGVSELAEHLREALAELDPRQAEVFCLACLEGSSYDEIAGQLRITVNHVGVLLNRARTFLRSRLAAHEPPAIAERKKV
ncbi:MAG TPA: sigma-70 family RNA polymerase sigma factor, partial [Pirellulales bacterium]|nr:sigma-70 family RNA polymerase sigma factor [Pirellulales bacterium]